MFLWLLEISVWSRKLGVALKQQAVKSSQHQPFQESKGITEAVGAQDHKGGPCVDS